MYRSHENEKKTKYMHGVREVEKSNFTPFVMSTTGGLAPEAANFIKRLSAKLSETMSMVAESDHQKNFFLAEKNFVKKNFYLPKSFI